MGSPCVHPPASEQHGRAPQVPPGGPCPRSISEGDGFVFSLARKTFPAGVHAWTLPAAEAAPSSHLGSRWLQGRQPSPGFQRAGPLPESQEVTSSRWAQPWSKTPGTLNPGELDQRETPASARREAGAHSPPRAHSWFPATRAPWAPLPLALPRPAPHSFPVNEPCPGSRLRICFQDPSDESRHHGESTRQQDHRLRRALPLTLTCAHGRGEEEVE